MHKPFWRLQNSGGLKLVKYSSMATHGYNREVLHLGTMEAGPRKARQGVSLLQVFKSGRSGQGSEAASASAEGAKRVWQERSIWELQRILDGKRSRVRKTHRSQTESYDKVWSVNEETEKDLAILAKYYERF